MTEAKYECMHEELLQDHNLKIGQLESRADFKDQRIGALEKKMDKMDQKLDNISQTLNDIKIQSNKDDTQLELRLKTIETELALMKEQQKKDREENQKRLTNYIAIITVALTVLSIGLNYIFK